MCGWVVGVDGSPFLGLEGVCEEEEEEVGWVSKIEVDR